MSGGGDDEFSELRAQLLRIQEGVFRSVRSVFQNFFTKFQGVVGANSELFGDDVCGVFFESVSSFVLGELQKELLGKVDVPLLFRLELGLGERFAGFVSRFQDRLEGGAKMRGLRILVGLRDVLVSIGICVLLGLFVVGRVFPNQKTGVHCVWGGFLGGLLLKSFVLKNRELYIRKLRSLDVVVRDCATELAREISELLFDVNREGFARLGVSVKKLQGSLGLVNKALVNVGVSLGGVESRLRHQRLRRQRAGDGLGQGVGKLVSRLDGIREDIAVVQLGLEEVELMLARERKGLESLESSLKALSCSLGARGEGGRYRLNIAPIEEVVKQVIAPYVQPLAFDLLLERHCCVEVEQLLNRMFRGVFVNAGGRTISSPASGLASSYCSISHALYAIVDAINWMLHTEERLVANKVYRVDHNMEVGVGVKGVGGEVFRKSYSMVRFSRDRQMGVWKISHIV